MLCWFCVVVLFVFVLCTLILMSFRYYLTFINVSKTCAFLQTTGGKDAPNRVFFPEIVANMTTWNSESKENVDRPSKTWGLLSVVWLLLKDLGIYKAIQLIISMQKQIILNNIYIGWFCLKIMLQEDKCIYIEWRENLACTNSGITNKYNNKNSTHKFFKRQVVVYSLFVPVVFHVVHGLL
jgi:hypothetical protein